MIEGIRLSIRNFRCLLKGFFLCVCLGFYSGCLALFLSPVFLNKIEFPCIFFGFQDDLYRKQDRHGELNSGLHSVQIE